MHHHIDGIPDKKKLSVANHAFAKPREEKGSNHITDNRPEAIQVKRILKLNDTLQSRQFKVLKHGLMSPAQNEMPVQRTEKDAYTYLKKTCPDFEIVERNRIPRKSLKFYLTHPKSPLKPDEKIEFLQQFNLNLPEDQQAKMGDFDNDQPEPQAEPQPELTEEQELDTIWTPGKFGKGSLNAISHFQKHVINQKEFGGKFQSVIEYARAAKIFWQGGGGLTANQKHKGLAVRYDQPSNTYTLSVEDGGLIATFFEIKNIGGRGAPIEQIVELTGMDKRTVEELIGQLPV